MVKESILQSRRLRIAGGHLGCSVLTAALVLAACIFLWYPTPFLELSGGGRVFLLLVACDVCIGPLLSLIVAAPAKSRRELVRDIAMIAVVQFIALGYGLHSLLTVRPAYVVFEAGHFVVTEANEVLGELPSGISRAAMVPSGENAGVPPGAALWRRPVWTAIQVPKDRDALGPLLNGVMRAGVGMYQLPGLMVPIESAGAQVLAAARTREQFAQAMKLDPETLDTYLRACKAPDSGMGLVPLSYRDTVAAVAVSTATGSILAVCPLGGGHEGAV